MKRCKNGEIHFKNSFELNQFFNKKLKPIIDGEIEEYHKNLEKAKINSTKEALTLILPIACTSLYEAFGFAEKRQEKFIDCFTKHIECLNEGVTDLDDYQKWCKDNKIKYFEVVEVENE